MVGRGGDEPVVLVRVADGQSQMIGEWMAHTERARNQAAREQCLGDGRGTVRCSEVHEHEVRDRRADGPASRAQGGGE